MIVFAAGIDADNVASARCAASAGFSPDSAVPDWEGVVYQLFRRPVSKRGTESVGPLDSFAVDLELHPGLIDGTITIAQRSSSPA